MPWQLEIHHLDVGSSLEHSKLVADLIEAVKELQQVIENLKETFNSLIVKNNSDLDTRKKANG